MPGPRAVTIMLSAAEREVLTRWERSPKTAQALALRARIVLACAGGGTNGQVAAAAGVSVATVAKWRNRFAAHRLGGLSDEARPGRPRTVSEAQVREVITKTLEQAPPDGDTHWSSRSMAAASGLSQSTVSRIWRAFDLEPANRPRTNDSGR
ncbi:Homeodomain-like domain-containing protein [Frankia sp. EI5c]|nr:helix-turn-helix domain-containing protein [Frankia sp. EI5c]OAA19601.1 Homeodomain-like domain-containing protein [Frankia sp. EI5c]